MTLNRLRAFAATALLLAASPSAALRPSAGCGVLPATSTGETAAQSIQIDALVRTYRLHLPTASQHCATATTSYPTSADGIEGMLCTQRADCATEAEVVSCGWQGGHAWPAFGRDVIWDFFRKHSRRDYISSGDITP